MERKGSVAFAKSLLRDYIFNTSTTIAPDGADLDESMEFITNEYPNLIGILGIIRSCMSKDDFDRALIEFAKLIAKPLISYNNDTE